MYCFMNAAHCRSVFSIGQSKAVAYNVMQFSPVQCSGVWCSVNNSAVWCGAALLTVQCGVVQCLQQGSTVGAVQCSVRGGLLSVSWGQ